MPNTAAATQQEEAEINFIDRGELMSRYKLAHFDHRAEIALNWDRQKLILVLNPVLTLLTCVALHDSLGGQLTLAMAAATAFCGALILYRSHTRARVARAAFYGLEDQLDISLGRPRGEWFRISDVVIVVSVLHGILDVTLAVLWR